jgi:hypothetical protein
MRSAFRTKIKIMKTTKLTVEEAIKQGYTHCGWSGKDWQSLNLIEDMKNEEDFKSLYPSSGKLVLAEKKPQSFLFDAENLRELVAENIGDQYRQECADDTDEIEDLIKEIDFTEIVNTINEKISVKKWWMLTDIELVLADA